MATTVFPHIFFSENNVHEMIVFFLAQNPYATV